MNESFKTRYVYSKERNVALPVCQGSCLTSNLCHPVRLLPELFGALDGLRQRLVPLHVQVLLCVLRRKETIAWRNV